MLRPRRCTVSRRTPGFRTFKAFHMEQAIAFKRHLAEQTNARTGKPLSKATIHSTLAALKAFFRLAGGAAGLPVAADLFGCRLLQPVGARCADRPDAAGQAVAVSGAGAARHRRPCRQTTRSSCSDRALVAFILLTGARDGAVASLKLKHLDLAERCVIHDAREVATKFGKSFTTWFFPVGDDVRRIVEEWAEFLTTEMLWGPDDPLFPATRSMWPGQAFHAAGLSPPALDDRRSDPEGLPPRLRGGGLPYYPPHRLRDTLAALASAFVGHQKQFKAWGQNLGHSGMATTFRSYGASVRRAASRDHSRNWGGCIATGPSLGRNGGGACQVPRTSIAVLRM